MLHLLYLIYVLVSSREDVILMSPYLNLWILMNVRLDCILKKSSILVLHFEKGSISGNLVPLERNKNVREISFVSDNFCGIFNHFHCNENVFMTFKYIGLIFYFFWCEFKCDRIIYLSFLNTISTPCSIFLIVALSCAIVFELRRLTAISSLFCSFSLLCLFQPLLVRIL